MCLNIFSQKIMQWRIQKFSSRKLSSFNWFIPYLILPFHPITFKAAWKFIGTVIKDFVILQFFEKWKIYKIPIVNVQIPLDDQIPFIPEKVEVYIHFINFWLSPITMLFFRLGPRQALPAAKTFLFYITKAYSEATKVYSYRLSTTDRPDYKKGRHFKAIHRLDPHYLCVPSLHVAIVVLTFSFFKTIFERANFTQEEKKNWNEELYSGALAITESVLFVKQHSVNCVSAAMYMMTKITPFITAQEAQDFISHIFENSPEIDQEKRIEIVKHIMNMFNQFSQESRLTNGKFLFKTGLQNILKKQIRHNFFYFRERCIGRPSFRHSLTLGILNSILFFCKKKQTIQNPYGLSKSADCSRCWLRHDYSTG